MFAPRLDRTFVAAFSFLFLSSVLAADEIRNLDQFACLKQSYRTCENLDDVRSIVSDVTKLNGMYVDELLQLPVTGFPDFGEEFSTFDCHAGLVFLARTLKSGLAGVERDVCAARGIAEFVALHSWKAPTSTSHRNIYASTIFDSIQILDEIYLGDWAAIRSTEGNKSAQCYQSVTQLKQVFDWAAAIGLVEKGSYRVEDIDELSINIRTLTAVDLARAAAAEPDGNQYSRQLVEQVDKLFPDLESDGIAGSLLGKMEHDILCASQELE